MIKFQWPFKRLKTRQVSLSNPTEWIPFTNNFPPSRATQLATVGRCLRLYSDFAGEIPLISSPPGHYLLGLIRNPNTFMSRQNLFESLCFELLLNGNFMARVKYNGTGQITRILPYRAGQVYCYPRSGEYSDAESIDSGGYFYKDFKGRVLMPDSVWHIRDVMFSNSDLLNGLSRSYLYATAFESGSALANAEKSLNQSSLKPPWLLSGLPESSDKEIAETRSTVDAFLKSGALGILTLPGGYELKSMMIESVGPVLKYLASKSDLDIARIFSVPIQLIGRSDALSQAGANDLKESTRFFIKSALASFLKNISDSLENLAMDGTKFHFEIDRFRASDLREQSQYIKQLVDSQVLSTDDARKML